MCGIVGIAGKLNALHDKIFQQLLIAGQLRGFDSTGIAAVNKQYVVKTAKQVGTPENLFADKRFDDAFKRMNTVLIGHNRWATQGKVNRANAHPFEFDSLVGVHNGTLDNMYALDDSHLFQVDSELLYYDMDRNGVHRTVPKLRGAWALNWWDKTDSTINFIRNKERPLTMVMDASENVLYWASEKEMLQWILERNQVDVGTYVELEPDMLVSMHVDNEGNLGKASAEKLEGAIPFVYTTHSQTGIANKHQQHKLKLINKAGTTDNPSDYFQHQDVDYQEAKNVIYTVVCKARDFTGADYVILFDQDKPEYDIRLYLHSCHAVEKLPTESRITCSVSSFIANKDGGYYKVSPWSVKVLPIDDSITQTSLDSITTIDDLIDDNVFEAADRKYYSRHNWLKKHSECCHCSSDLIPEQDNGFTAAGQILCPECKADPEISQYVNLVN